MWLLMPLREKDNPQQGVAWQDQGSEPTRLWGRQQSQNSSRAVVLEMDERQCSKLCTSAESSKRGVSPGMKEHGFHQSSWHSPGPRNAKTEKGKNGN